MSGWSYFVRCRGHTSKHLERRDRRARTLESCDRQARGWLGPLIPLQTRKQRSSPAPVLRSVPSRRELDLAGADEFLVAFQSVSHAICEQVRSEAFVARVRCGRRRSPRKGVVRWRGI
jgi:hypothetical protein